MKYTDRQLEMIHRMAAIYLRPSEIAVSIDVPEDVFKADIATVGSVARTAYLQGKLSQKVAVREQMAMLARVGSPAALDMSERALLDMEDDE